MPIIYLAMRNLHSGLGLEDERSDMTELEALRELVAFREYGTLSAAADELRITQPTMTRTMRKLERELGVPLFDRRAKNRLSLTHTGELAAQEAEQLLDAYDRLEEEPIQGENISSSRSEIEHTLEVLHSAFEKLFDDTYQDLSLDVSADISVLHAMLAQEGLTEGPFDVKP